MCGIIVIAATGRPVQPACMDRALARLAHRGPDGQGLAWRWDGRLGLGHRRLTIFGPGPAGDQPMESPRGDLLVFNGSLYNYVELRAQLAGLGHVFRTDSDTEVILAAWAEWGQGAFARFNGTWALVLHDHDSDRLVVSRDRLGVRPLYWCRHDGATVFASEVRAVVAATGMTVRVDPDLAFDFLALGQSDHLERTMVEGVAAVPAGALWVLDRQGRLETSRYHTWPAADPALDAETAARALPDLLLDATRLRLRAHVPVAAQLSGGLDSGAAAWAVGRLAARAEAPFLGFFAYGYDGSAAEFDEIGAAIATRDHVAPDLPLHQVRVAPTPTMDDLGAFLRAQELPVSTPSPLAGLRLYRAMRQAGAVVALTGDGSDELFAGYTRRYLPVAWRDALLAGQWGAAWRWWRSPHLGWRAAAARLAWSLPRPLFRAMMARRPHMAVLAGDFAGDHGGRLDELIRLQTLSLDQLGPRDAQGGQLSQILRYADRNAMACGMESRSPFLDWRVADLAMRLPMAAKVTPLGGKMVLRQAMRPHLPARVHGGAKNRGLGHAEQFRVAALPLAGLLAEPPAAARDFVDVPRLAQALRRHPGDPLLWWAVCLLLWLREVEDTWR